MTDFDKVNRCSVAIVSLRRQLTNANDINELTLLAGKIIELEQELTTEKLKTTLALEKKKNTVEKKIDLLKRKLLQAEEELALIKATIKRKRENTKNSLDLKISLLNKEYTEMSDILSETSDRSSLKST